MMKNIEWNDAQVKQPTDESIWPATRYLGSNKRQSGSAFAVIFAILAAIWIWGIVLFILANI